MELAMNDSYTYPKTSQSLVFSENYSLQASKISLVDEEKFQLIETVNKLSSKLLELQSQIVQLQSENQNLKNSQIKSRPSFSESTEDRTQENSLLFDLERIASCGNSIQSNDLKINNRVDSLSQQIENFKKKFFQKDDQINRLQDQIKDFQSTVQLLKNSIQVFELQLKEKNEIIQNLKSQLNQYKTQSQDTSPQKTRQMNEALESKQNHQNADEEKDYLKKKIDQYLQSNNDLRKKNSIHRNSAQENFKKFMNEVNARELAERRVMIYSHQLEELKSIIAQLRKPLTIKQKASLIRTWLEEQGFNGNGMNIEEKVYFMNWCEEYFKVFAEIYTKVPNDYEIISYEEELGLN